MRCKNTLRNAAGNISSLYRLLRLKRCVGLVVVAMVVVECKDSVGESARSREITSSKSSSTGKAEEQRERVAADRAPAQPRGGSAVCVTSFYDH